MKFDIYGFCRRKIRGMWNNISKLWNPEFWVKCYHTMYYKIFWRTAIMCGFVWLIDWFLVLALNQFDVEQNVGLKQYFTVQPIIISLKALKILSFSFIWYEAFRGLEALEGTTSLPEDKSSEPFWRRARLSLFLCILVIVLLTASTYGEYLRFIDLASGCNDCNKTQVFSVLKLVSSYFEISHLSLKIVIDWFLAILPLAGFMYTNKYFVKNLPSSTNAHAICKNYLNILNIPVIGSMIFILVLYRIFLTPTNQLILSVFMSGAVAFLIFVSLCLALYVEEESKRNVIPPKNRLENQ